VADVRIYVNTEVEVFPAVGITRAEAPDTSGYDEARSYLVPRALLEAYEDAMAAVDETEEAILRHIAERYPDAEDVKNHLATYATD
jgi:hypothetical protein